MKTHPAAEIFPLLEGAEFQALVADIREHNLREAIWRDRSGRILDGRNRLRACKAAGVEPRFRTYEGDDVVSFVISLNLHRRHLTESQRSMAAARLANLGEGRPSKTASIEAVPQTKAAELVNVSRASVQRAKKVLANGAKELVAAVDQGRVTVSDAVAIVRKPHPEQITLLDRVAAGETTTLKRAAQDLARQIRDIEPGLLYPPGVYQVIVIDPPWESVKSPYPSMSRDELEALQIRAASTHDSVLWIWTTHRHFLDAFFLIMRWGFNHEFVLTWVKGRLGQRLRYKSEFCIMAVRGSPKVNLTNPTTVVVAPARQKNGKPDEFYEMVDSFCVGNKLDYFSRKKRDGWEQYGNDPAKFGDVA